MNIKLKRFIVLLLLLVVYTFPILSIFAPLPELLNQFSTEKLYEYFYNLFLSVSSTVVAVAATINFVSNYPYNKEIMIKRIVYIIGALFFYCMAYFSISRPTIPNAILLGIFFIIILIIGFFTTKDYLTINDYIDKQLKQRIKNSKSKKKIDGINVEDDE